MKRCAVLLAALALLLAAASAAAETGFEPIPWDVRVSPNLPHEDCFLPDNAGYHDASLDVRVETFRDMDTTVTVVRVGIADPSQLRCELSKKFPSKVATVVPTLAKRVRAVLAINGDYFICHGEGIAARNGRTYRVQPTKKRDTLIIDENGDFTILPATTLADWKAFTGTPVHVFCFGPGLVINGEPITDIDRPYIDLGQRKLTERIALAQTGPLQYMIVATEGPDNPGSRGYTIVEFADLCARLGCVNAYNLDGGSSATIVLNYRKINALSTHKIRPVGDCIWFATLVPNEAGE